jgi:hypothetical protein
VGLLLQHHSDKVLDLVGDLGPVLRVEFQFLL